MSVIVPPIKSQGIKTKLVPWIKQCLPLYKGKWDRHPYRRRSIDHRERGRSPHRRHPQGSLRNRAVLQNALKGSPAGAGDFFPYHGKIVL